MLCHALATKQVNTRDTRTFVKNSYKNGVGVVFYKKNYLIVCSTLQLK